MAVVISVLTHICALTAAAFSCYNVAVSQDGIIYTAQRDSGAYVGQTRWTLAQRRASHNADAKKNGAKQNYPFARAIRKYGVKGFAWRVLANAPVAALDALEITAIAWLSPRYNATTGGRVCAPTPEITAKKKAWWTPERRAARSAEYRARKMTPPNSSGIRRTAKTRARMGAAKVGEQNPNYRHGRFCGRAQ